MLIINLLFMQTIKEIISDSPLSPYTGSQTTYDIVSSAIKQRWGEKELKNYDPYNNALTFVKWASLGYRPKANEKAIRSITFVEVKDDNGKIVKRIKKNVFLFYILQVEKVEPEKGSDLPISKESIYSGKEVKEGDRMISEKQKNFLTSLIQKRIKNREERKKWLDELSSCTSFDASEMISSFLMSPR